MDLNEEFDGLGVDIGESPPPAPVLTRRAIVVVGSHRSGTSGLARMLGLVGCDLPKHVMPPHADNELGFWEPAGVVQAHDTFLANIGSSWDDVAALPDGAFVSAAALELRQELALLLHEEYGTSPLFVVKDPRISRLLPVWFAVLAELQVAPVTAIAVRNPLEVAASLKARNGFTTTKSLLLWLRHTLESEQHSRGRPRSIVMYDELLRDWQGVLARVGEDLAVTWPGRSHRATVEIENFLSEQHRHHVFDWRDLEGRADVVSWVKEAYFALRASNPVPVLAQVRDELSQADTAFGPIVEEARLALQASQEQTLEAAAARDALVTDVEARSAELEARAAEVEQLQGEIARLGSAAVTSEARLAEHEIEMSTVRAERDGFAAEIETVRTEIERLKAETETAKFGLAAMEARASGAREELLQQIEAGRRENGELAARLVVAAQSATRFEGEAAAARTGRDAARSELEAMGAEATRLAVDHKRLGEELESAGAITEDLRDELRVLQSASARHRRLRERAEHLLAAAEERLASVERKAAGVRREALQQAAALGRAAQRAKRLDRDLLTVSATLDAMTQEFHALERDMGDRDAEISRLSVLNEELLNELAVVSAEPRGEPAEVPANESADSETIARLNLELEQLQAELAQTRGEVMHLTAAGSVTAEPRQVAPAAQDQPKDPQLSDQLDHDEQSEQESREDSSDPHARMRLSGVTVATTAPAGPEDTMAARVPGLRRIARMLRTRLSKRDVDAVLASGLFSPADYHAQLTHAKAAAPAEDQAVLARHYLLHGEGAGLVPSLLFDPDWYAAEYPDVLGHRNLLLHFIEFGDVEHRSPHPLFDPAFYTRQGTSLIERPYAHFRARPNAVSSAPHPMLDLRGFLDHRSWDAEAARDPFVAFLEDVTDDAFLAHVFQGQHYAHELGEPYDPQQHNLVSYLKRLRVENVSAHPTFDAEFYLRTYPDVRAAGRHAHLHYLLQGREEGRQGREAEATAEGEVLLATPMQPERDTSRTYDVTVLRPTLGSASPTPIVTMPVAEAAPSSIASRDAALRAEVAARFRLDRAAGAGRPQSGHPTISFLMPVFRPPLVYLDRAIRSVLQQSFGNWQLCIVDDASQDPAVADLLRAYASSDERISVAQADWNGGIAQATNAALSMAKGEYVGLLDHDDMLTVDAVELLTKQVLSEPDTDLVYSDECTLDTNDVPLDFFSKPDWSPFLLLSCMYTGHLSVYRRALVEKVGGFRSGYDFSQDYDLALRVAETNPRVQHMATCLYGWRSIPESAAQDGKPYARETNIAALQDALDRREIPASAEALPTSNRFVRHVSARTEFVSIIIPSDDLAKIRSAVMSIQQHTNYGAYEIIVVTNSRISDQVNRSMTAPAFRCVNYDKPFNFSDKCNVGARSARGSRFVFLNDDVEVLSKDWLEVLLDTISLDGVGAAAPRLVYEDGSTQHAGMVTGVRRLVGTAFHGLSPDSSEDFGLPQFAREVSLLSGACLMVPAEVFSEIGGFDPQNTPTDHSDVDLCFRIRDRGLRCVYTPFATLRHLGHQSLASLSEDESTATRGKVDLYLLKRWSDHIAYDPYFTPRMRDRHFRDSQETFMIFPGVRSPTPEASGDVLLVSHELSNSGAPRVLLDLARVLRDAGCYVCVCAPADGPMREQFAAQGIDVIVDELLLTGSPSVLDLAAGFDFAVANTAVTWQFVGQVSGSVPMYWFFHESELIPQLAQENHGFVDALRAATGIWAVGPLPTRQLMKLGVPVQTLTLGIDVNRMPGDPDRGSDRESVVVGMFGSYEPRKGQDLAVLGVLGMAPEARKQVRLELWGRVLDAPFHRALRELAADCAQIHIGPELSYDQCLRQLANSDVVLVPSRDDPLPLSSLEALACSRILVVSRTTGTSEYLEHGISAFILEENSAEEIAETLTEIVEQGDLYPEVKAAGRAAFEAHFSWEGFTAQVHDLLAPEMNQLQRSASGRASKERPAQGSRQLTLRARDANHPLCARAGSSDLIVFQQIFVEREYRCLDDIADARLVIDCGANVGYSAAYFLSRFPMTDLIAVEPDPENFELLQQNLRPYGTRATALRAGIWPHPGRLVIEEAPYRDGLEWTRQVRPARPGEPPTLRGVDLGSLLRDSGHETISVLKIDIEGTEALIFAENYEIWLGAVKVIVAELHDDSKFGNATAAFERAIADRGFVVSQSGELTVARRLR